MSPPELSPPEGNLPSALLHALASCVPRGYNEDVDADDGDDDGANDHNCNDHCLGSC